MVMLVGILMLSKRINFFVIAVSLFVSVLLGFIAYSNLSVVKLRVDDTFSLFGNLDISGVNLSTYALASNFYVTERVLESNFLFGHGLGSHAISHAKFINDLTGVENYDEMFVNFNQEDANSLALRTLSELGIIGIIGIFFFMFKNYANQGNYYQISRALILYFIYKLLREGHYFSPEMYFFVFTYYFVKLKSVVKLGPQVKIAYTQEY
jgi:O-antigen ligase